MRSERRRATLPGAVSGQLEFFTGSSQGGVAADERIG
jgi:hypothetical protein